MSLHFLETLRGSWFLVDAPDDVRVCEMAITVAMHRPRVLTSRIEGTLGGTVTLVGLATQVAVNGTFEFRARRPRRVSYEFTFTADDGRVLQFKGAKQASLLRPVFSATTLFGSVTDGDKAIAMARLHFDLRRDLVAFLQSLARKHDRAESADGEGP